MPSILEALYVPSDEIVQPLEPSHAQLRGVVTDITVLYGGFLYVHALFGITNSSKHLVASRGASDTVDYRISTVNTIERIVVYGNDSGSTIIDAKMQRFGQPLERDQDERDEVMYSPGLEEIAGKMACANEQFSNATPLIQTRLVVQDHDPVPDFMRKLTVIPSFAELAR